MCVWHHFRNANLNGQKGFFSCKNTIFMKAFSPSASPDWMIRIASLLAVIDAYSHSGVDFSFLRCGCKNELDFINQPVNSVSFAFKAEIDGFFRRRAFTLTAGYTNIHRRRGALNTRACMREKSKIRWRKICV